MMPRKTFANWHNSCTSADTPNLDALQEMRQWVSGYDLLGQVLESLVAGTGLSAGSKVQVRDMTMYDVELPCAIMNYNSNKSSQAVQPVLGYVGAVWIDEQDSKNNALCANVDEAIDEQLMSRLRDNSYPMFILQTKPVLDPSLKPKLQEEITRPRDMELPVRQTVYDIWAGKPYVTPTGHTFEDIIKIHDAEFNPSGFPFKTGLARALDSGPESVQQSSCPPVELPAAGDPIAKEDLIKDENGTEVTANRPEYSLVVTSSGELWMHAFQDYIVPTEDPLFILRGNFKKDEESKELKKSDPDVSWVIHELNADSMVRVTFKTPLKNGQWPVTPSCLGDFMLFLEKHDHVKVDIKLHTCKKDPEHPDKFLITVKEQSLLAVPVLEGPLTTKHTTTFLQSCTHLGWQVMTRSAPWLSLVVSSPFPT